MSPYADYQIYLIVTIKYICRLLALSYEYLRSLLMNVIGWHVAHTFTRVDAHSVKASTLSDVLDLLLRRACTRVDARSCTSTHVHARAHASAITVALISRAHSCDRFLVLNYFNTITELYACHKL
jgi:hypothetical protein